MRQIISATIFFLLFSACGHKDAQPSPLPPGAKTAAVTITDLHCWVEKGQFFVIGICHNQANEWQKIWLDMQPLDSVGQALEFKSGSARMFPVYADAVPPKGRSSFFAYWGLASFNGQPDSAQVSGAGAQTVAPGPLLVALEQGGVKMMDNDAPGGPQETRWLANAILFNPLDIPVPQPRSELLIYGTDNRLWMSTILNPEDRTQQVTLKLERNGPMAPGEKRQLGCFIFYENLPQRLQEIRIGRVEFLPFAGRSGG